MILYFVRHGETDWNVKKKIQGKTDVPLNENGKQQAKELADMLLDRKKEGTLQVVRAYTSPQLRAAQTAQEAAIALDIPCIAADGLREMDMGDWEGRSWESITQENTKEYQDWDANRRYVHTPHGECYNEVLRRALDTLGMILERETEDVLIVTHSGVLMALRCYIADRHLRKWVSYGIRRKMQRWLKFLRMTSRTRSHVLKKGSKTVMIVQSRKAV